MTAPDDDGPVGEVPPTGLRALIAEVLTYHCRIDSHSCRECGPQRLGSSFSAHQADAILAALPTPDAYQALLTQLHEARAEVARLTVERDTAQEHVAYHLRDFRPGVDDKATGDLAVDMAAYSGRLKAEVERLRAGIAGLAGTWGRLAANGPATFAGIRRRHAAELRALLDGEVRP